MLFLCDIESLVLVDSGRRSFAFQLENHDAGIMASGEEIDLRVGGNNPESI